VTSEESSTTDLEMVAAALRADMTDIAAFLEGLASWLEQALPGLVEVRRSKSGFRGPRLVSEIEVHAGDLRLALSRSGAALTAVRRRVSGGIVIKTESLDLDAWLRCLAQAVAEQAKQSEQARLALQRLVLDR